ncbi:MAG TPA: hypothetical protein VFT66_15460 [Roseiflexaceae bacterium]|nr:hypothetical protein [Roseiflexaceae bacterium]
MAHVPVVPLDADVTSADDLFNEPPRPHTVPAPGWSVIADGPRYCASHVATKIGTWHATKDAAIQATWQAHIAPGALVCRVCAQRAVDPSARYLICDVCRADLPAARALVQDRFNAAVASMEQQQERWEQYQALLAPDVAAKWQQVEAERTRLERALVEAETGRRPMREPLPVRVEAIQAARAALDTFMAKVERTRNAPQHLLYPVLQRQAQYDAALHAAADQTRTATEALQEIEDADAA